MNEENGLRFLLDDDNKAANFVYRPPNKGECKTTHVILDCKFAQSRLILDDWWLIGGTRWSRTLFRLKHPIVYSKRGIKGLWRRIKRQIVGDPPMRLYNALEKQRKEKLDSCLRGRNDT